MTSRPSTFRCIPVALLAAVLGLSVAGTASADPRAQIRGELDSELRAALVRAIGETDGPPTNGFDARRRARAAMASAEALLRSEGYYQPVLADIVEGEENPVAIVEITPGHRFVLAEPVIHWIEAEPEPEVIRTAQAEIELEPGDPGRAADVIPYTGPAPPAT